MKVFFWLRDVERNQFFCLFFKVCFIVWVVIFYLFLKFVFIVWVVIGLFDRCINNINSIFNELLCYCSSICFHGPFVSKPCFRDYVVLLDSYSQASKP